MRPTAIDGVEVDPKAIVQHVRNQSRQKVGTFIAVLAAGKIVIGWSKCNRKDRFDPVTGKKLAMLRIWKGRTSAKIPNGVREHIERFVQRAKRYFKTNDIVVTGQ